VDLLVENALDFLTTATSDLETRRKQSVIAFYTAVELFLKARLMHEHWSLVVAKAEADREKFIRGDFISVTFEDACKRLEKIIGSPLSKPAIEAFDAVRQHRNKMVHFYHQGAMDEDGLEAIALQQLSAWLVLRDLITAQWRDVFKGTALNLHRINQQFSKHRQYFRARYVRARDHIEQLKRAGERIDVCPNCEFPACQVSEPLRGMFSSVCHACAVHRGWLASTCPLCEAAMEVGGDTTTCPGCYQNYAANEIADRLDYVEKTPTGRKIGGNCAECHGENTVIDWDDRYVCVLCIETFGALYECNWCGEYCTDDIQDTYHTGCINCGGAVGMA
jgi:hypothetical protein